jgi:hypothetical protein
MMNIDLKTSLQPHQSFIKYGSYILQSCDFDNGSIIHTSYVTALTLNNHEVSHECTIDTPLMVQKSSIHLSKVSVSVDDWVNGMIKYKLCITNNGNTELHNINISDPQLNISTDVIYNLKPYGRYTILKNYTITHDDYDVYLITNTAMVHCHDMDENEIHDMVTIKTPPCVVKDTLILMFDGSVKPIQYISRGEMVSTGHMVARLCETILDVSSIVDFMIFEQNSIGLNQPNRDLMITCNHPIIYRSFRYPARCFAKFPKVFKVKRHNIVHLYDLQFENDGSYIANGIEIQSCSPYSVCCPLPKELYFNQSLYTNELVWDEYNHPIELRLKELHPIHNPYGINKRTKYHQRHKKFIDSIHS